MREKRDVCYISVDVEAGGPNPGNYPLLSIGACVADAPERAFYVELRPTPARATPDALAVSGLSLTELADRGLPPGEAMLRFEEWLAGVVPEDEQATFVGYNAAFDWMFVCDYFYRYLDRNPFGHAALDIKSLLMGVAGVPWPETGIVHAIKRYGVPNGLTHNALEDAIFQARLFQRIRQEWSAR